MILLVSRVQGWGLGLLELLMHRSSLVHCSMATKEWKLPWTEGAGEDLKLNNQLF